MYEGVERPPIEEVVLSEGAGFKPLASPLGGSRRKPKEIQRKHEACAPGSEFAAG